MGAVDDGEWRLSGAVCSRCRWKLDEWGCCPCDDAWWMVGEVSDVLDRVKEEEEEEEEGRRRERE